MENKLQKFRKNNIPSYGFMLTESVLEHKKIQAHLSPQQGTGQTGWEAKWQWYKLKSKMLLGMEFPQYLYAKTKSKEKMVWRRSLGAIINLNPLENT